jgi:hypothetical protein
MKDEAVKKGTGRSLAEWYAVIQKAGWADASHKQIADFLHERHDVSYWWAQEITVEYEKHIGRRKPGQTQDGLFQIGVSKTINAPAADVWKVLQSRWGISLLTDSAVAEGIARDNSSASAPDGLGALEFLKGKSVSGIRLSTTTFESGSHVRMQWQRPDWSNHSILQVRVMPKTESKTILSFHQEKLPTQHDRREMREYWQHVAGLICKSISNTNAKKK